MLLIITCAKFSDKLLCIAWESTNSGSSEISESLDRCPHGRGRGTNHLVLEGCTFGTRRDRLLDERAGGPE